jgi:hypothetical protein
MLRARSPLSAVDAFDRHELTGSRAAAALKEEAGGHPE